MARHSQQRQFVEALARLGGSAGNSSLREKLGWDERLYTEVRAALMEEGKIAPGRGRGGSVRLAQREEPTAAAPTSAAAPPRSSAVNRRANGPPDRRAKGTPFSGCDGLSR